MKKPSAKDRDTFLLTDRIKIIKSSFIKDGWVTIYESSSDPNYQALVYCCLVDAQRIESYRLDSDWVIRNGSEGKPAVIQSYKDGKPVIEYRTYSEQGIEPFIFSKHFSFNDGHDFYIDVSEEFILYFRLYEKGLDKQNRKFYFIDDSGELDEVIIIERTKVKVKLKYLKEYISIRKIYFSICFDFMRFYNAPLSEMEVEPMDKNFQDENLFYNHLIRPIEFIQEDKFQSWIHGKSIINYNKTKTQGCHFDFEDQEYESFITGYDDDGNEILKNCKKENEKHFIVTYFKKEVLNKYYNNPDRYEVDGWHIKSKFFTLKIDNNNEDYVAVFLPELCSLPHKEQLHWKQYNIPPQEGISHAYYRTMIEGSWAEHPETPDLYFKYRYEQFNKKWESKFGWKFYKTLSEEDKHHFDSLHIPTTNNKKAFCDQVLSLVKITIDSLNEKDIKKGLNLEPNDKGISKLDKFLISKDVEVPEMMEFLRSLQDLRSGLVAHRFSSSNTMTAKALEYFSIGKKDFNEVARDIFIKSIWTMNTLEKKLI